MIKTQSVLYADGLLNLQTRNFSSSEKSTNLTILKLLTSKIVRNIFFKKIKAFDKCDFLLPT